MELSNNEIYNLLSDTKALMEEALFSVEIPLYEAMYETLTEICEAMEILNK